MTRTTSALSLLQLSVLSLLSLTACHHDPAPAAGASAADAGAQAPAVASGDPTASAGQTGAAPIGPISSRGQKIVDEPTAAHDTGDLAFDVPKGWESKPPSSNMRLAQGVIPGPGGPGEFAVFFFGAGGGGSAEANIERWIGQMESKDHPKSQTFEANGFKVTWVEVQGTLQPTGMGSGPTTPQPNSRLLGAVVEGAGGPWFFKATGPEKTLAAEREHFLAMLKGVHAKGAAA